MKIKRFLSACMSAVMMFSCVNFAWAGESDVSRNTIETYAQTAIKPGEYLQMGTYYDEPILWRCTAYYKITGYDDNGNPIVDAMEKSSEPKDGYLPLMVSDKILCIKAFDAEGTNTSGSHGRGYVYDGITGYYRQENGSNYWGDSNIRDWLNSDASAGNVVWSCGNPPDKDHMMYGYNAYDKEAGFLNGFTSGEKSAILTVTQKQLLDGYEYSSTRNSDYHQYNSSISSVLQNYDTAYSETTTDKIFLLDVKQVCDLYNDFGDYHKAHYTSKAEKNNEGGSLNYMETNYCCYWLRSPMAGSVGYYVRTVDPYGSIYNYGPGNWGCANYDNSVGVRPAFFLNPETAIISGGSGSENDPYVLNGNGGGQTEETTETTTENIPENDKKTAYAQSYNDFNEPNVLNITPESQYKSAVFDLNVPVQIGSGNLYIVKSGSSIEEGLLYSAEITENNIIYAEENNHKRIIVDYELWNTESKKSFDPKSNVEFYFDEGTLIPEDSNYSFKEVNASSGKKYIDMGIKIPMSDGLKMYYDTFSFSQDGAAGDEAFYGNDLKRDNNGKIQNRYEISDSFMNLLMDRGVSYFDIINCLNKRWGGSCHGMASLVMMSKVNKNYIRNIKTNKGTLNCLYESGTPAESRNIEGGLRDQINYLHMLQASKYTKSYPKAYLNTFLQNTMENVIPGTSFWSDESVIKEIINKAGKCEKSYDDKTAFLLLFSYYDKQKSAVFGHTVTPFSVRKTDEGYNVYYYDPNYDNSFGFITISSDYSSIKHGADIVQKIGYIDYSDLYDLIYNKGSKNELVAYTNDESTTIKIRSNGSFTVSNGVKTIKYSEGQISGDTDIIKDVDIESFDDMNAAYIVFKLEGKEFVVKNDAEEMDCIVKANGKQFAIEATNADSITLNADTGVVINGDVSDYKALMSLDNSDENFALINGENGKNIKLEYTDSNTIVYSNDNTSSAECAVISGTNTAEEVSIKNRDIIKAVSGTQGVPEYPIDKQIVLEPYKTYVRASVDGKNTISASKIGSTVDVDFDIIQNEGFATYTYDLYYDPTVLRAKALKQTDDYTGYVCINGTPVYETDPNKWTINDAINNIPEGENETAARRGKIRMAWMSEFLDKANMTFMEAKGDGRLFTITFEVIGKGDAAIHMEGHMGVAPLYSDERSITYEPYPDSIYVINEKSSFTYGDAGGSGKVDASDASMVLQKALSNSYTMPIQEKTADWLKYVDVNINGSVDADDAANIMQKTLNGSFTMPIEKGK